MPLAPHRELLGQSLRFGIAGGVGVAIDVGVLAATGAAGISPYAGRLLSLALMLISTWWLNRSFTFRTAAAPSWREFRDYCLTAMLGVATNYGLYALVLFATGNKWLGLIVGSIGGALQNFVRMRRLLGPS